MNNPQQAGNEYEPIVPGFETPPSPVSSYNNIFYITEEEEKQGPPRLPPHLSTRVGEASSSTPRNHVVLNHMYTDAYTRGRQFPLEAVAVSTTQRLGSQYVTTMLYKPAPRR
ncbi:hypothetical protein DM860_006221 [Cuscuta australis]|uniref:Association with the SNF1 complex (ASC) domain-containing protein n=1 Tax=Cuscuta australis TaxID=267555 RepID=A0A328DK94_9ASTE|nr:hypothetical protein DM860_006221 [Cuscuta australis]